LRSGLQNAVKKLLGNDIVRMGNPMDSADDSVSQRFWEKLTRPANLEVEHVALAPFIHHSDGIHSRSKWGR